MVLGGDGGFNEKISATFTLKFVPHMHVCQDLKKPATSADSLLRIHVANLIQGALPAFSSTPAPSLMLCLTQSMSYPLSVMVALYCTWRGICCLAPHVSLSMLACGKPHRQIWLNANGNLSFSDHWPPHWLMCNTFSDTFIFHVELPLGQNFNMSNPRN